MKFEVEIDDRLLQGLSPTIAEQLNGDAAKRRDFGAFAIEQALAWMAGRTNYRSLTEQQIDWLLALLPLFCKDQGPTAERIYNVFSVPFGQAAYIARVLQNRDRTAWRLRGRQSLLAVLRLGVVEAQRNIDARDGAKYVPISVSAAEYRELTVLLEALSQSEPGLKPPINKASSPGRRTLDVPSLLFPRLIKLLEA